MTPRERVIAAIEHREPDRVPVDMGATPSSGISAIAYGNLTRHLGLRDSETYVYDVVQQLAETEDAVLDLLQIDAVDVGRSFNDGPEAWRPTELANGAPALYPKWFEPQQQPDGSFSAFDSSGELVARMPAKGTFYDQACFPWEDGYPDDMRAALPDAMGKVLWAALVHSPWDRAGDPGFWDDLRKRALALRESTDRALVIVAGCNLFEWGTFLRRMDNFLVDLLTEPVKVEKLLDELMEVHLATLDKVCAAVGDVCDVLRFGDDLGMESGPFMPPEVYRTLFKPRHTKLCEYVHKNSQMKTFLHSCGSIYEVMGDLVEAGYDVINPVQTTCRDMDAPRLKKEFGKDICFWGGGCDTRRVLNQGTPDQIKDHVKERLDILAPGGGFVFNTVHNILPEVPPENIVAMFEALGREVKR